MASASHLREGETLGVVGESGCGKSTLARAVLKLLPKTERDGGVAAAAIWSRCGQAEIRALRKDFQIVFQDPLASLDPRMPIGQSIAEPLQSAANRAFAREHARAKVRAMMARVGLDPGWINRYPHEFSGGQNQRVGIARAMIVRPKLRDLRRGGQRARCLHPGADRRSDRCSCRPNSVLSLIFISHDLSVVRQLSHRVMVLYLGRVVELADRDAIYEDPRHPYTRALLVGRADARSEDRTRQARG